MRGQVWLQGGAEFSRGYAEADAQALAGPSGAARRVVVAPFAGRPGREREVAGGHARRGYAGLGADDVTVVLREDDLLPALDGGGLLVVPGGSPARLLDALAPVRDALADAVDGGLVVTGSSAGAMVLCRWTMLPDRGRRVVSGLGLVPVDYVLVHYRGGRSWLDAARDVLPERPVVLGLPEGASVAVEPDGALRRVGDAVVL